MDPVFNACRWGICEGSARTRTAENASQWVINLRSSVRPVVTYVFIALLLFVDIAGMIWAIKSGVEFQTAMDIINKKFSIESTCFEIVDNEYGWIIKKEEGKPPTMTQWYKCTAKSEQGSTCTEFFAEKAKWEEHVRRGICNVSIYVMAE